MKTLRPYQVEAISAVRSMLDVHFSTVLVLPTGTGKTVVMAKLASEWPGGNVLLLAHRIELLDQAADKLEPELGYRPPIEQGLRAMDTDYLWQGGCVLVGSVQTMRGDARLEKFSATPFDLILIDECHHATAASYLKIVNHFRNLNPRCRVLGVTATPRRADNTALGIVFESAAYQLGIGEAIEDGWLVPIRQEYVSIDNVDFSTIRSGKNELGETDFKPEDLEQVLVEEQALHALAGPILEKAQGRKTLVFTAGVAHAHMLAAVLDRYKRGSAAAVDGETLKTKRAETVEAFHRGELQFLCNYGVFTEGFDVPPCSMIAMGRPTKSVGLYTQMLGRGTRPLDGVVDGYDCAADRKMAILRSDKPHMLVLDFVGNSQHKLVSSVDVLGGNYDVETRELATRRVRETGGDIQEELEKAKAEIVLLREQAKRRGVTAAVQYQSEEIDPFAEGAAPALHLERGRGGSTDSQIQFLVNLGVEYQTAAGYSKHQASAVIEKLKATRCTKKQQAILKKHGFPHAVPFDKARAYIDAIASSGWALRFEDYQSESA